MHILRTLALTLLLAALPAAPSSAQQASGAEAGATLSSLALDAALAGHESAADLQRARLADLLARDDVREVARDRGIDMERVESAAAGLSDAQVRTVSSLVDALPQEGGGGLGTVTIGVGALIVVLLILIVLT